MIGLFWGGIGAIGFLVFISRPSQARGLRQIRYQDLLIAVCVSIVSLAVRIPAIAVIALVVTLIYLRQRRLQQAEKILNVRAAAWPDAIDFLISSLRAGMPIASSLIALCEQGPEELREVLLPVRTSLATGATVQQALVVLREKARDPVADRIAVVLEISQYVGGSSLAQVLRSLASYVRAEFRTRSELIARQSWTTNAAKLAAFAPWAIVLILSLRAHEAYATLAGSALLFIGAAATLVGYLWMRAAARLPLLERLV